MDINNFICANKPGELTFEGGRGSSTVDITLIAGVLASQITGWRVVEEETLSDHRYISFRIRENSKAVVDSGRFISGFPGWIIKDLKKKKNKILEEFSKQLVEMKQRLGDGASWGNMEGEISKIFFRTCDKIFKRRHTGPNKRKTHAYWWDKEVSEIWKRCNKAARYLCKRKRKRESDPISFQNALVLYNKRKKELRKIIKNKKLRCWRELIKDLDRDVWGLAYKIIFKKFKRMGPPIPRAEGIEIIKELFPSGAEIPEIEESTLEQIRGEAAEELRLTKEELIKHAKCIRVGKAPGSDGIPGKIVKLLPTIVGSG
nr:PREDICTED: uncharacterized protein LOC105663460 [Megachile rotundata]